MLEKEFKKDGYNLIELRSGINGSGNERFSLQTERTGSKGQSIKWCESFNTKDEAEKWVKYCL